MNYFSPERPRINFLPAYCDKAGRRVAPLPDLTFEPRPDSDLWQARLMLKAPGRARGFSWYYSKSLAAAEILQLLEHYKENPEEALDYWFGYEGPDSEPQGEVLDPEALGI